MILVAKIRTKFDSSKYLAVIQQCQRAILFHSLTGGVAPCEHGHPVRLFIRPKADREGGGSPCWIASAVPSKPIWITSLIDMTSQTTTKIWITSI